MSTPISPECAVARPLSPAAIELVAHRFAVLAEPMRLRLLQALFGGEQNVNALVAALGGTQSNISRHLQTLTAAGILGRRKEGLEVYYCIADDSILRLCELVCGSLERQLSAQARTLAGAVR